MALSAVLIQTGRPLALSAGPERCQPACCCRPGGRSPRQPQAAAPQRPSSCRQGLLCQHTPLGGVRGRPQLPPPPPLPLPACHAALFVASQLITGMPSCKVYPLPPHANQPSALHHERSSLSPRRRRRASAVGGSGGGGGAGQPEPTPPLPGRHQSAGGTPAASGGSGGPKSAQHTPPVSGSSEWPSLEECMDTASCQARLIDGKPYIPLAEVWCDSGFWVWGCANLSVPAVARNQGGWRGAESGRAQHACLSHAPAATRQTRLANTPDSSHPSPL